MKSILYLIIIIIFPALCIGQDEKIKKIERFSKKIKFLNQYKIVNNKQFQSKESNALIPLNKFLWFKQKYLLKY